MIYTIFYQLTGTKDFHYIRNHVEGMRGWKTSELKGRMNKHSTGGLMDVFPKSEMKRSKEELFDLRIDPHEVVNVSKDRKYSDIKKTLSKLTLIKLES